MRILLPVLLAVFFGTCPASAGGATDAKPARLKRGGDKGKSKKPKADCVLKDICDPDEAKKLDAGKFTGAVPGIGPIGKFGEDAVQAELKKCGYTVVATQVSVDTSKCKPPMPYRRIIDIIVKDGDKVCAVEVKVNGSDYKPEQKGKDDCIKKGDAILQKSNPPPPLPIANPPVAAGDKVPPMPTVVVNVDVAK